MASRTQAQPSPEVIVIGAGAFGGWTALYLREKGALVTLVDAYGPGNSRASSGGETRQIRAGYEDRELYTRWVLLAFDRWKARQEEWGRRLLYETGRLLLAPEWDESLKVTKAVLDKYRVPNEVLSHDELRRRYPQMDPEGVGVALFEPTTGVLKAREGCMAVAEAFQRKGGRFRIGKAQPGRSSGSRLLDVALANGPSLPAATFVFACGPWLPKVFPEIMKKKLFTPRRDVFFFGTPSGDDRFSYPRDYLGLRFPALKDQPVVESRVCQLEMSVDEHFIIQRHPALENVWLVGGGSGHGYKHGPVVGEYVADRVLGQDKSPELESVFRLKPQTF